MRSTTARSMWQPAPAAGETSQNQSRSELGRRAILAGWLITMLGIAGYIVAMSRAGENADILDGLMHQGLIGWMSGALILAGVVTWFIGNFACLQDLADIPASGDE